jgi:hypothetical protein
LNAWCTESSLPSAYLVHKGKVVCQSPSAAGVSPTKAMIALAQAQGEVLADLHAQLALQQAQDDEGRSKTMVAALPALGFASNAPQGSGARAASQPSSAAPWTFPRTTLVDPSSGETYRCVLLAPGTILVASGVWDPCVMEGWGADTREERSHRILGEMKGAL